MHRDPWWYILLIVACLVVAAVDTTGVPVFSQMWWPILYGLSAVSLLGWRVSHRVQAIELFGAFLGTASGARAFVRVFAEPRYGAAALNVLIVILVYDFVRRRQLAPYTSTGT